MRPTLFVFLLTICLIGFYAFSTTAQVQQQPLNSNSSVNRFQYATLTTQLGQDKNRPVFTVVWNSGDRDVIGRSNVSVDDARRRLSSQLGRSSNARTNLSVLLNNIGQDGWRLVDSNVRETQTTRIFMRTAR